MTDIRTLQPSISFSACFQKAEVTAAAYAQSRSRKTDRPLQHPYVYYSDLLLENCLYVYNLKLSCEIIIHLPPFISIRDHCNITALG